MSCMIATTYRVNPYPFYLGVFQFCYTQNLVSSVSEPINVTSLIF
jgi:hypothetical protein